eukprot:6208618-Prymnesium_polylepis.1
MCIRDRRCPARALLRHPPSFRGARSTWWSVHCEMLEWSVHCEMLGSCGRSVRAGQRPPNVTGRRSTPT